MCDVCMDTGYYGDNGPGRKGNREFSPCDCKSGRKDLFIEDEKNYFSMPCVGCKNRNGGVTYCTNCIHYA